MHLGECVCGAWGGEVTISVLEWMGLIDMYVWIFTSTPRLPEKNHSVEQKCTILRSNIFGKSTSGTSKQKQNGAYWSQYPLGYRVCSWNILHPRSSSRNMNIMEGIAAWRGNLFQCKDARGVLAKTMFCKRRFDEYQVLLFSGAQQHIFLSAGAVWFISWFEQWQCARPLSWSLEHGAILPHWQSPRGHSRDGLHVQHRDSAHISSVLTYVQTRISNRK